MVSGRHVDEDVNMALAELESEELSSVSAVQASLLEQEARMLRQSSFRRKQDERRQEQAGLTKKLAREKQKESGLISQEQMEEYERAFEVWDKDGDGQLSADELEAILRDLGRDYSREEVEDMLYDVDTDESGYIELGEFKELVSGKQQWRTRELDEQQKKKVLTIHKTFDSDHDGLWTYENFFNYLSHLEDADEVRDFTQEVFESINTLLGAKKPELMGVLELERFYASLDRGIDSDLDRDHEKLVLKQSKVLKQSETKSNANVAKEEEDFLDFI